MKGLLVLIPVSLIVTLLWATEGGKSVTYVLDKKRPQVSFGEEGNHVSKKGSFNSLKRKKKQSFQKARDTLHEKLGVLGKGYLKDLLSPFSKEGRLRAYETLRENKALEELAIRSLVNLEEAYRRFGNSQASIRVLTLDYLKYQTRRGEPETLEAALLALLSRKEERSSYPGGDEDVIELLVAWVEGFGKERILADPRLLFERFQYEENFREIFARSIAYLYPRMVWDREKSELFLSYLIREEV